MTTVSILCPFDSSENYIIKIPSETPREHLLSRQMPTGRNPAGRQATRAQLMTGDGGQPDALIGVKIHPATHTTPERATGIAHTPTQAANM